jgi:hypothetical protein
MSIRRSIWLSWRCDHILAVHDPMIVLDLRLIAQAYHLQGGGHGAFPWRQ